MAASTMTSKGQITVPKEVRDELGLTPGTRVAFERNVDGDYVLSTATRSVKELAGVLQYDGPGLTLEQMDDAIAAGAAASV